MNIKQSSGHVPKKIDMGEYFEELEGMIVQKLHEEAMTKEGRVELIRNTGVDDAKLIDELVRLGITADGLMALRLFPLVLVAWAEDSADSSERNVVMTEASRIGVVEDSTAWVLLDTWLKKRPPGLGVDAWKRYTHDVFMQMSVVAARQLIDLTKHQMKAVAKASGGHLGFGKVSKKEQIMIDRLTETMTRAVSAQESSGGR